MVGSLRLVPVLLVAFSLIAPLTVAAPGGPGEAPVVSDLPETRHYDDPGVFHCVGFAPLQTHCELGSHDDSGGQFHDCVAGPGYTGTIMSELYWPDGSRWTIYCDYENGERVDTDETDTRPWFSGIGFTHHCSSYDLGTKTAGGSGVWGCILYHGS